MRFLSLLCKIIYAPGSAFPTLASGAFFGSALGFVLIASLLFIVGVFGDERLRGQRKTPQRTRGLAIVTLLLGLPAFIVSAVALLTFVIVVFVRLCGVAPPFEGLFSIVAVSLLPLALLLATELAREINYVCYRVWQCAAITFVLWNIGLVWIALNATMHLIWWQTIIAALPIWGAVCGLGLSETKDLPKRIAACRPWKRLVWRRVVVYYSPDKNAADMMELARIADATLAQAAMMLEVTPLAFRISVFLFDDKEEFYRLRETEGTFEGYALDDCICILLEASRDRTALLAHEFTHVLVSHCVTPDLYGLLDEGLACYVEAQIKPTLDHKPSITLPLPLRYLARHDLFFEWRRNGNSTPFSSHAYYAQAFALAQFLIRRDGMAKYKQLCREAATLKSDEAGAKLDKACRSVYGWSLKVLESEWRVWMRNKFQKSREDRQQEIDL